LEIRLILALGALRAISIAARNPAPPAPTMATSDWIMSIEYLFVMFLVDARILSSFYRRGRTQSAFSLMKIRIYKHQMSSH